MKHHRGRGIRGAWLAAAAGIIVFASAAQAQSGSGAEAPGAALRRQLTELAANPQSVSELVETGRAALAVGDGEAALGFFTRADQLGPRDARVKAGLAAGHARTGRPETALVLFSEALSLGAPEGEIAAERGLAHDLLGQTARAQQDYLIALRHRDDPEVRRRLALSLAISGQRDAALRLIEDQVRQGDRAANRARVMVLALSGDVRGATDAAATSLPAQAAQAITPFLPRLASLSPGQMASAANLGRVPGGTALASARTTATADPAALAFAGGGSAPGLSARLPVASPQADGSRRRPGGVVDSAGAPVRTALAEQPRPRAVTSPLTAGRPRGGWVNASSTSTGRPTRPASEPSALLQPHPFEPLRRAASAPAGTTPTERPAPVGQDLAAPALEAAAVERQTLPASAPLQLASAQPLVQPAEPSRAEPDPAQEQVADGAAANLAVWNSGVTVAPVTRTPAPTAAAVAPASSRPGFSDVIATVSALPEESATPSRTSSAAPRSSRATTRAAGPATPRQRTEIVSRGSRQQTGSARTAPATTRSTTAATRTAAGRAAAANPRQAHPSRIWVQLGVSSNRNGFGYEIRRMRTAAPELLRNQTPHVAPIGSNHRLLVGPFPSEAAARTVINGLRQKNIQSITWTSPAGTEVTRFTPPR